MKMRRVTIDFPAELQLATLVQGGKGQGAWGAWLRVPETGFLQGAWAETPQQAVDEARQAIDRAKALWGGPEATPLDELDL